VGRDDRLSPGNPQALRDEPGGNEGKENTMETTDGNSAWVLESEGVDSTLSISIGVAYANFAETVERKGGNGNVLREKSLEALEEALRKKAGAWKVLQKEGEQFEKLGRFEEAANAYREAMRSAPWNASLKQNYFRARVLAALTAWESTGPEENSLRERPTQVVNRKPKSARIRKYYRLGRISNVS
jgi:tetratricopeptide (TPR) repeat protein